MERSRRSEELINGHFTTGSNWKKELAKSNIEQPEPIDKLNPTEPVKSRGESSLCHNKKK
jgi:hypothetical protein